MQEYSHRATMVATSVHLLAIALAALVPSAQPAPVPAPGCRDKCGNISVPYPFGIDPGCYRDDGIRGFRLECDETRSPPVLTINISSPQSEEQIRLAGLGLEAGEARAFMDATRECYNSTDGLMPLSSQDNGMSLTGSPYRFSNAKNSLVSLGCPVLGYFIDTRGYYISGCMSVCRPSQYTIRGLCTGVGCCQSSIPPAMDYFEPYILNFPRGQGDPIFNADFTSCRYVFLVETQWLTTSYSDHAYLNRSDGFSVPLVLDWAIRNVDNCTAGRHATDYACRSKLSECVDSINGPGYRCSCLGGYQGNPYLDGGCKDIDECQHTDQYPCFGICTNTPGSYICQCPPGKSGDATRQNGCRPNDKFTSALRLVTGVSTGVFLLGFICFWLYLGLQKRKLIRAKRKFFQQNGGVLLQQQMRSYDRAGSGAAGFKIFSTEELHKATDGFAADRVLGRGGHGIVYKGVLEDKRVVAIKKSKMMEEAETKEFAREMFILSQINHRNVVKLLGCCLEVEVPMLVYEFVSNGTLYHYIHDKDSNAEISLDTRLRIAAEAAEALAYMHSSASPPILHGDVKTANILLDDNLTAKVSDFGTSKLAPNDEAQIATLMQGTCGYLDPEYLMTCHLTDKSDVYSFGVVLLELLTRKKALHFQGQEKERSLVSCFIMSVKAGRMEELLDSQVRNEMSVSDILQEIVDLVMQCVSMSGEERPHMKEVAERLVRLRRYQQHSWAHADGNPKETQGLLLVSKQPNGHQQHAFNIEDGSIYFT